MTTPKRCSFLYFIFTCLCIDAKKLKNSPLFNPEKITPLNEGERLSCEGQITSEECYNALKDFKVRRKKNPGTNGFPA